MKLKVSRCRYATLGLKGLTVTNEVLLVCLKVESLNEPIPTSLSLELLKVV